MRKPKTKIPDTHTGQQQYTNKNISQCICAKTTPCFDLRRRDESDGKPQVLLGNSGSLFLNETQTRKKKKEG